MSKIKQNHQNLLLKIKRTHQLSLYKNTTQPKLIAVSKKQSVEKILEAINCGQKIFGENRIQESDKKWRPILKEYKDLELHLIGPLQSNKVKLALDIFDVIHSLDRESLAFAISKNIKKKIKTKSFFIQVNTGKEKQKSGIFPEHLEDFYLLCTKKFHIPIQGLMCIPPVNEEPSIHFSYLNKLCKKLNLKSLSMGMSNDYREAIKFGATHIRVGTSFFGERIA